MKLVPSLKGMLGTALSRSTLDQYLVRYPLPKSALVELKRVHKLPSRRSVEPDPVV
jgi:hypothetical protein